MKITKLFHWLYACVMLAPVFAVVCNVAYVTFNKNAKDSYSDKYIQQKSLITNTVDMIANTDYEYVYTTTTSQNAQTIFFNSWSIDLQTAHLSPNRNYTSFFTLNNYFYAYYDNYTDNNHRDIVNWGTNFSSFTFNLKSIDGTSTNTGNKAIYSLTFVNHSLDNAFYYGMEKMSDSEIFGWANDSFLAQPITYITDLFGMPQDSPIITLLSYWLDISIIWLTFDVIMYVPLLVHRWLDKGVLE